MPPSQAAASLLAQVPVCISHTSMATPPQMCLGEAMLCQIPLVPICISPHFWGARGPWQGKKEIPPQIHSPGVTVTLLGHWLTLGPSVLACRFLG